MCLIRVGAKLQDIDTAGPMLPIPKLQEYFLCKENKNNDFIQQFLLFHACGAADARAGGCASRGRRVNMSKDLDRG